jgi:hypothetical protein
LTISNNLGILSLLLSCVSPGMRFGLENFSLNVVFRTNKITLTARALRCVLLLALVLSHAALAESAVLSGRELTASADAQGVRPKRKHVRRLKRRIHRKARTPESGAAQQPVEMVSPDSKQPAELRINSQEDAMPRQRPTPTPQRKQP